VNVRLITATNRSLDQDLCEGVFRSVYRLSVFPIHLPPLRERREDIPLLADFLLRRVASRIGRQCGGVEPESMDRLIGFSWPGNIRQLQNVVEHSAILCGDPLLRVPPELMVNKRPGRKALSRLDTALQNDEQQMIERALEETSGRVSDDGGAAILGVPASTLESKIKRFRIDKLRYRAAHQ
jgi:DNA-binding NtrC family response regulator